VLEVRALETSYGASQVLFGVSLAVGRGEIVSLIGRNGMGKTTTVHSIMGVVRPRNGALVFDGGSIFGLPSHQIARRGIGLVPEGRQIFPNLTVHENLVATAANRAGRANPWTLEKVYELFPGLRDRQRNYGDHLSGGEQQMLAIGRALMTNPCLLVLDEATEGLAPVIRAQIYARLERLRGAGLSILIVDRDLRELNRVADRHYVLEKGRVAWSGTPQQFAADPGLRERYLGV